MIVKNNEKGLEEALKTLKRGGVIVYPSETSYGLGADYTNKRALKKVYKIKKRQDKKMIILVSSLFMIKKHAEINKEAETLMKNFMPGPLTLVAKGKEKGTIAFRISSNEFANSLVRKFRKPIVSTSANISGQEPIYRIKEIKKIFENKADLIVDGGNLKKRKPSTVYDVENHKILRIGPITERKIKQALSQP